MFQQTLENNLSPVRFRGTLDPRSREIHERAQGRAKKYLLAEAELLTSIIEVDRDQTFKKLGSTHLTPYCVEHLGLSQDVAENFVRVARKSVAVPELKVAIDEGRLTVTTAKVISSVLNSQNHEGWIAKAETLSKSQLETALVEANPLASKPEKAKPIGNQKYRVEFELTSEQMEKFRRAQDLVCQNGKTSQNLAETLEAALDCFLEKHDPILKARRAKVRAEKHRAGFDPSRDGSSDENRRPSQVESLLDTSSQREPSTIPAAVIHAVNLRDLGRCQAQLPNGQKCEASRWVHFHHIVPRELGGPDTAANLITLCSGHHRIWHSE